MLKDSRSYEVQIIDAVRSVNRALGGTYGTSSAIHKSDFNQYEVQLIDAIKGIGRTLSGKGLSVSGVGGGEGNSALLQDLSRRVSTLEGESFFRLVDGNVTLKSGYSNLWVPGWLAAGGIGSGSGGGGSVDHLSDIGDVTIDTTTLSDGQGIVWDATNNVWKNANVGGGGGSGSVTSVGISVPTGLSVTGSPITSSGTITIKYSSGYKIPTTTKQTSWDNKQDAIADLSTIRAGAALGATAIQTETDPTVPSWAKAQTPSLYVGTTQVQTSSAAQNLTGILSVKAASENTSKFEWDSVNGAWHFLGNLYADGWVSAGGIGSGSSGGSVVSISNLLSSGTRIATITINGTNYNILAPSGSSGAVTRIDVGNTSYSPVGGVVTLPAYLPLSGGTMTGNIVMSGADIFPSADLGSSLGYSSMRFSNLNVRTIGSAKEIYFKDSENTATTGYLSFQSGYMNLRAGTNLGSSYKQINLHETYGFYPEQPGVNLGYNGANYRWANIYGVNADLSGDLSLASTSHIDIGPLRIEYDATNKALHITKADSNDSNTYGLYADGFVAAGGVGQTS